MEYTAEVPFLKTFIRKNLIPIRSDPITGREMVDIAELDIALQRHVLHKRRQEFERKADVDVLLKDIVDRAIAQME